MTTNWRLHPSVTAVPQFVPVFNRLPENAQGGILNLEVGSTIRRGVVDEETGFSASRVDSRGN